MGCLSEVIDQGKNKRVMKNTVRRQKVWASKQARDQNSPTKTTKRPGVLSGVRFRSKVKYMNADELVVDGKELEFKDRIRDIKEDTAEAVETKHIKEIRFNLMCPEGHMMARWERRQRRRGDWSS